jgi:hypothetical protein
LFCRALRSIERDKLGLRIMLENPMGDHAPAMLLMPSLAPD